MANQSNVVLLNKLKNAVEKIEKELSECKKIIESIENNLSQEIVGSEVKTKKKTPAIEIDPKTFVSKIEEEFKANNYDSLTWLVTQKTINRDLVISILKDGGIVLQKSTTKGKISDEVKNILSIRHSFSKS